MLRISFDAQPSRLCSFSDRHKDKHSTRVKGGRTRRLLPRLWIDVRLQTKRSRNNCWNKTKSPSAILHTVTGSKHEHRNRGSWLTPEPKPNQRPTGPHAPLITSAVSSVRTCQQRLFARLFLSMRICVNVRVSFICKAPVVSIKVEP